MTDNTSANIYFLYFHLTIIFSIVFHADRHLLMLNIGPLMNCVLIYRGCLSISLVKCWKTNSQFIFLKRKNKNCVQVSCFFFQSNCQFLILLIFQVFKIIFKMISIVEINLLSHDPFKSAAVMIIF